MKRIKAYIEGKIIWAFGSNRPQSEGHFHFVSFTPLNWERIVKIWANSKGDKRFFACATMDKYAVLRVTPKDKDNLGICSGFRGAKRQYLFIDYDNVPLEEIREDVKKIMESNGLRRGLIVRSSPDFDIVEELEYMDGTEFYDFNREKLYKFLINGD